MRPQNIIAKMDIVHVTYYTRNTMFKSNIDPQFDGHPSTEVAGRVCCTYKNKGQKTFLKRRQKLSHLGLPEPISTLPALVCMAYCKMNMFR